MREYNPKKIEAKWQKTWAAKKLYQVKDKVPGKKNEYLLVEFPYPSGNLHVGHWYAFSVPDMLARFGRMNGKNVLYPIGFDAFGLPAENAAIKNGLNPRIWTNKNMAFMRKQIASMGTSFDWSREVVTCDPAYYKWTQWQFLQFFKKGLAYRAEREANWCPKDKTVLANEQVVDGTCERCGSEVEQRKMLQWNMRITQYADRLLEDLEPLDWPSEIKDSQKNWIGKSEGAEITFTFDFKNGGQPGKIPVFTTRPDTLFGATYLVMAPEHPWVTLALDENHQGVLDNRDEVIAYVKQANKKTQLERQENKEKTGVKLEGVVAINPANNERIPVFVADYVLGGYGTGAIMAVPAHDERDFAFAKKFNLPIKPVIAPHFIDAKNPPRQGKGTVNRAMVHALVHNPQTNKYLVLAWKKQPWKTFVVGGVEDGEDIVEAARREVAEETGYTNLTHKRTILLPAYAEYFAAHKDENRFATTRAVVFELADTQAQEVSASESDAFEVTWMSFDELERDPLRACAEFPVWKAQLAADMPYDGAGRLINSPGFNGMDSETAKASITKHVGGRSTATYRLKDWNVSRQRFWGVPIPIIHCKTCGEVAVPEKDLPVKLPDVKDYLPTGDGKSPLAKVKKFVQVKCPQCKKPAERETDTFDTFVDSSWYFLRYTDPKNKKAFADKRKLADWMPVDMYSGGAEHTTMHVLYSRFWHKALYDLKLVKEKEPYTRRMNRGLILGPDGAKMSKSKGNVIDPDAVVAQLGADTVRLYLAFIGPYNEPGSYPWSPDSIVGVRRFLERVWRLVDTARTTNMAPEETERVLHQTIKKVTDDVPHMKYNTAIAQMMIFVNAAEKHGIALKQYQTFLTLLAPFAPHITEELWAELKNKKSIHLEKWPKYDKKKLVADTVTVAVQVNGKVRTTITIAPDAAQADAEAAAHKAAEKWMEGKTPRRTIYVPGRIVNIVI